MSGLATGPLHVKRHAVQASPYLELENPFTVWEAVKLVILAPLALLRLLLLTVTLLVFALLCAGATVGAPADKPLTPWRHSIVRASRHLGRVVVILLGFWVTVKGWKHYEDAIKQDTRIIVFNHPSWVDTILLLALFAPSGVSRASNARIPVIGTIVSAFQNIYTRPNATRTSVPAAIDVEQPLVAPLTATEEIAMRLPEPAWPVIAIAPEGMTSNGKQLLRFRSGAFVNGVPVLPVCMSYHWKRVNPAWTLGGEPWHILRLLTQFVSFATVDVLPTVVPTAEEAAHPVAYAENVRKLMATALDVPCVDCGISEFHGLEHAGVSVNWRGKIRAPEGAIGEDGCVSLPSRPSQKPAPGEVSAA